MQRSLAYLTSACAVCWMLGCQDAQEPTPPYVVPERVSMQTIACRVDVGTSTVSCSAPLKDHSPLLPNFDIVGGQGVYVQLTSSNVYYNDAAEVFYADVTVENLRSRRLGTPDGSTVTGVRVFFHSGPTVTSGSGTVEVRNPDGTGSFTGSSQPYFEYAEMLGADETSGSKTWEWNVPSTVETFAFEVYVEGDVPPEPLPGLWQGRHLGAGYYVGTMGLVFTVNPEATGVTEITYYADGFGCAYSGEFVGWERKIEDYPGWEISGGELQFFCNALAGGDLALCYEGTFDGEYISGPWDGSVDNPLGFCSGTWSAKPATRLFPRSNGSQRSLSTENSPPGGYWIETLEPGVTHEWTAVLGDSLIGDVVTFRFALRGDDGRVYLVLRVNESTFANVNFGVSADFTYYGVTDWTWDGWNALQGEPGDELHLRITYQGTGLGGLLYGHDYESSVVVPGRIAISSPSGTASVATATYHNVSRSRGLIDHVPVLEERHP